MLAIACLMGCTPTGQPPAPPGAGKAITSFSFPSVAAVGIIDQEAGAISVKVPAGTAVSGLVAVFDTTGIRVTVGGTEQVSGVTANDFTGSVEYVVTAEDGSMSAYVVTVTAAPPLSSEKAITVFSILAPAAAGRVDHDTGTIRVTVPHGTDVSSLVAVYSTTGKLVTVEETEQTSGKTINDFTDPLTYVVTAEDGSTRSYIVTVEPAPGQEKEITSFSIQAPASAGIIDQDARIVRVRLPDGAGLSSLVAVFETTGTVVTVNGVEQASGVTINDFTNPVDYVVTAEDGSAATYSVRVVGTIGLVINEMDVDQVGVDTAEYIELYALADIDLVGIVIVLINGGVTPGQEYARIDLTAAGTFPGGSSLVVAGPGVTVLQGARKLTPAGWESSNRIQNGPNDAVMLFDTIGRRVIDTVTYNGALHRALISGLQAELDATEGAAGAPADSNSTTGSIGRHPNGQDTGQNSADFRFSTTPTPGAPNP